MAWTPSHETFVTGPLSRDLLSVQKFCISIRAKFVAVQFLFFSLKYPESLRGNRLLSPKILYAMSKFKCKCLNVTVHVKEKATREANGKAFVSETCTAAFFDQELYEVELAVGGITKVNISLDFCTQIDFQCSFEDTVSSSHVKVFLLVKPRKVWRAFCFSRLLSPQDLRHILCILYICTFISLH